MCKCPFSLAPFKPSLLIRLEAWISERMCKDTTVAGITGQLTHFLIEPFVPHEQSEEFYVCIQSHRYKDEIFFYHEGGVDVGDVDAKASKLAIPTGCNISEDMVRLELLTEVETSKQQALSSFIKSLFTFYKELHFAYLEINPIAMLPNNKAGCFEFRPSLISSFHFDLLALCRRLCPWTSSQRLMKPLPSCPVHSVCSLKMSQNVFTAVTVTSKVCFEMGRARLVRLACLYVCQALPSPM